MAEGFVGASSSSTKSFLEPHRRCTTCKKIVSQNNISWDLMSFCNVICLLSCPNAPRHCTFCLKKITERDLGKHQLRFDYQISLFCNNNCLENYVTVNKICSCCERIKPVTCTTTWLSLKVTGESREDITLVFCSASCYNTLKNVNVLKLFELELPTGTHCSVCMSDYQNNFVSTLVYEGERHYFCSTKCESEFKYVKKQKGDKQCDMCNNYFSMDFLTAYYNGTVRVLFCSSHCKNLYRHLASNKRLCDYCRGERKYVSMFKRYILDKEEIKESLFCSVSCLLSTNKPLTRSAKLATPPSRVGILKQVPAVKQEPNADVPVTKTNVLVLHNLRRPSNLRNVAVSCSVLRADRTTNTTETERTNEGTQTEAPLKAFLPIPVPVYVPLPAVMYTSPTLVPVPVPIPIPVPIFIPTTRNSSEGIMKEISRITNSTMPADPLQADIVQIADILAAEDKPAEVQASDSDIDTSEENEVWQDIEFDLECALPDNITQIQAKSFIAQPEEQLVFNEAYLKRGKKRLREQEQDSPQELVKRRYEEFDMESVPQAKSSPNAMQLDYTLGINAWKQWVTRVNASKKTSFLKTEILQMSSAELDYALCLFIQQLRKPNGTEYAPDTIYYLCLGIQFYLETNGRHENIFFDAVFQKFIASLDELAIKFCALHYDDSRYIVTRVEEEHLWETHQLGCYSPQILLHTIMYFNTKLYHCTTLEHHRQMSFFHIMRQTKKILRKAEHHPGKYGQKHQRTKNKLYEEMFTNEDPMKCPSTLYEYYIAKCPESVKNSYSPVYLVPEKYCCGESPYWYTTQPISNELLSCALNRIKMVKEINVALLRENEGD